MSASKAIKTIVLTATSQDSHTGMKIKSLLKWLKSGHEVRVQISGKADRQKAMESLFLKVKGEVNAGASVIQKVVKPDSIKFYLRPTKEAANIVIEESVKNENDELMSITADKDIFSEEFEQELVKSIKEDRFSTNKK